MAERTEINYLDSAWNVVTGCTPVSAGCAHCYARRIHDRRHKAYCAGKQMPAQYASPFSTVQCLEDRLDQPLRWRRPRRIGVCFTGDLFHAQVSDSFIDRVFAVMALAPHHAYHLLTKRPERMREYFGVDRYELIERVELQLWEMHTDDTTNAVGVWPLPNVWLGISVEDQATADSRIPILLQTPAAHRWLSYEPALAAVDFWPWLTVSDECVYPIPGRPTRGVDWIVCGGESGPGARPCDVAWIRTVVEQCKAAGVPVWVKQLGANVRDRNDAGFMGEWPEAWPDGTADEDRIEHDLDGTRDGYQGAPVRVHLRSRSGSDPSEWPADLRVREMPALWGGK